MKFENPVNTNEASEGRIPSRKTAEEEQQANNAVEHHKNEFLKEHGIELLSDEEVAEMSMGEFISYRVDMKNKILEVQNALPPKDFESSRVMFDEALGKIDMIKNPHDLYDLKKKFGKENKEENL
jgi:hypothetical protein